MTVLFVWSNDVSRKFWTYCSNKKSLYMIININKINSLSLIIITIHLLNSPGGIHYFGVNSLILQYTHFLNISRPYRILCKSISD